MKLKKALALLLAFCLIVPTPITSRAEESSAEQTSQSVTTETEDVKENLKSETDSENASNSQNKDTPAVENKATADGENKEAGKNGADSTSDTGSVADATQTTKKSEETQHTEESAQLSVQAAGAAQNPAVQAEDAAQNPAVQADDSAVKVGNDSYVNIANALNNVSGDVTIVLQQDLKEDVVIPSGRTVTLDLNGHHITNVSDNTITNRGTLTVENSGDDSNGYVDNVTHQKAAVYNEAGAKATLSGGTFKRSEEAGKSFDSAYGNSFYTINNRGNMSINGSAEVWNRGIFSSCIENGWYTPSENQAETYAELTIDGATIGGGKYAVKNDDYGILDIKNGEFSAEGGAGIILNWNNTTIEDGNFAVDELPCAIYNGATPGLAYETGTLTITGGTFGLSNWNHVPDKVIVTASNPGEISISGGTFYKKFDESFCAEGYILVDSLGMGYEVVRKDLPAVAQIGDTTYTSLERALAGARDGDTIKILQDVTATGILNCWMDTSLTIDLNGKKVTTADNVTNSEGESVSPVNIVGKLTIKDSSGGGVLESGSSLQVDGENAALTLESGTINVSKDYGIYAKNGGSVVINEGTVTSLYAPLTGNNTTGNMNFTVNGGTLTAQQGPAIYMPGQTNLTVTGGTLNGGISLRMGTVKISGGTINAVTENIDKPNEYYNYSGNAWFPDALYVFGGTYTSPSGNNLDLQITGGTFNCSNGQGSAVAIYDLGKVEQNMSVKISGNAGLSTNATGRKAYQVMSLSEIGVSSPAAGYGTYTKKVSSALSGGYYSTDIAKPYIAKDYECVKGSYPVNGKTYTYAIAKEGTLASVEATPGKADGGVASTIKPLDRDTAENIAGSATVTTKGSHAMVESVSSVVSDLSKNKKKTEEKAKQALEANKIETTGRTITTVVEPYFKTEAKEISGEDGKKVVTVEIKLYYQVKATVANDSEKMDDSNTVVLGDPVEVKDADTVGKAIEIQVKVPSGYFNAGDTNLYVRHEKEDGTVYYHKATLTKATGSEKEDTITFTNDKGFSPFTFAYVTKKAIVEYEGGTTVNYTVADVTATALPTASKAGYTFKGWKYSYNGTSVDGVYTGALTDDLLTKLDTLGNSGANTITATAQWEAQSQSAAGGNNGGGSSHKHKSSSNNNSTATATATATSTVVTVSGAKTGDNANIALLVVLIVLAGAGAAGILLYEKKRKRC